MNEIKCPSCGNVFKIDESGYAAIVKQVRDEEFKNELLQREAAINREKDSLLKIADAENQKNLNEKIAEKDREITALEEKLKSLEDRAALERERAVAEKTGKYPKRHRRRFLKATRKFKAFRLSLNSKKQTPF